MVASGPIAQKVPASVVAGRGSLVQFTVEDAMAMICQGRVGEDASAELLNGLIVHTDRSQFGGDPTMHSSGHRQALCKLTALVSLINSPDRHVQIQSPIVCGPRQMPEPDFAIVRGSVDAYSNTLPTAADVFCLIEVADSSLERDREEKRPIYAYAGIAQYIILNLRNRTAEVYADPDKLVGTYPPPQILIAPNSLVLRVADGLTLDVQLADLLS